MSAITDSITFISHDFMANFKNQYTERHFKFDSVDKYVGWLGGFATSHYLWADVDTDDQIIHRVEVHHTGEPTHQLPFELLGKMVKEILWDFTEFKLLSQSSIAPGIFKIEFQIPRSAQQDVEYYLDHIRAEGC